MMFGLSAALSESTTVTETRNVERMTFIKPFISSALDRTHRGDELPECVCIYAARQVKTILEALLAVCLSHEHMSHVFCSFSLMLSLL